MTQTRLAVIAFLAGACVMMLELCGSRVLAPAIGASFFVWTSLIGSVLAALSLGYWLGGRMADRSPRPHTLASILLMAGAFVAAAAAMHAHLLSFIALRLPDPRLSAVLGSVILFGPACVALGMVPPFTVRLSLESVSAAGRSVGLMTACSTLGSIVGTFLLGFFLFVHLGTLTTLYSIAAVLGIAAIIAAPGDRLIAKLLFLGALWMLFSAHRVFIEGRERAGAYEADTPMQHVTVFDTQGGDPPRKLRLLTTGTEGSQSVIDLEHPHDYLVEYLQLFRAAMSLTPVRTHTLMIGGGAYTFPQSVARSLPGSEFDVVEIDPGITEIARRMFFLEDLPNFRIFHEDARTFLRKAAARPNRYDVIFLDAYNSGGSIPFHLTTREFFDAVSAAVTPDGMVVMNVLTPLVPPRNCLLRQFVYQLHRVFPEIAVYRADPQFERSINQNVIIIGRRGKSAGYEPPPGSGPPAAALMNETLLPPPEIFTDDFAPAEYVWKFGC